MTSDVLVAGFAGALAVMTVVTYLCRISGFALMGLVPLTPRVKRGLAALPGCIVISAILPIADRSGPVAFLALAVALAAMAWRRSEVLALVAGLGVVTALRAAGL